MKLTFSIDYYTGAEERLTLQLITPRQGEVGMYPDSPGRWVGNIEFDPTEGKLTYRYLVQRHGITTREEWGKPHALPAVDPETLQVITLDRWQELPHDLPFMSQAFTECINRRNGSTAQAPRLTPGMITLSVEAPTLTSGMELVVTGNCQLLGNWNPAEAPRLNAANYPRWDINLPIDLLPEGCEYKFVAIDNASGATIAWEDGDNRLLPHPATDGKSAIHVNGLRFSTTDIPAWRGAGVAIPVFSLRSDEDCGVGDFFDLKKMAQWAASTGQRFIQILPINDTTMTGTWMDSYPYNANSTFALHPMYLRLEEAGVLPPARMEHYRAEARRLNTLKEIDYVEVNRIKNAYTRELYAIEGRRTLQQPDVQEFIARNASWLTPYAAYCVLRDIHGTPEHDRWGTYATYNSDAIDHFISEHRDEIGYVYFVQYHLDRQLREVQQFAHSLGVAIKGDIPIGISRTSVDAWTQPELFNLATQAGAPPDDFSVLGQNWGFPTYNWDTMAQDGYSWWKARFKKMADYCDAYRIDHVLGFFRIWQIPLDAVHGLLGIFNPALPLSAQELDSTYGFKLDPELMTIPYITEQTLADIAGDDIQELKSHFLTLREGEKIYRLRDEFKTQRQVAEHFASQPDTPANQRLRDELMLLIDDVLFIADPTRKGMYHPRISAYQTHIYRWLDDDQRERFDRMYWDFFYHRHNDFWQQKAMEKLPPLIQATGMLTCAEDLGMIPHCVPAVMDDLRIIALEIQRMPKTPGEPFGHPERYPYMSVCTTSTHDMGGIRQWWEENRANTLDFYTNVMKLQGEAPQFATPAVCEWIVRQNLSSPSMLCILPLQDWLSIDGTLRRANPLEEQINVPANSRHYWRYRMHLPLETLLDNATFNKKIETMIIESGR